MTRTHLTSDGPSPTYDPVTTSDCVVVTPETFLHIYNGSELNDAVIISTPEGAPYCQTSICEAGGELLLGPFDMDTYAPTLLVGHTQTTDVVMAILETTQSVSAMPATIETILSTLTPTIRASRFIPCITLSGTFSPAIEIAAGMFNPAIELTAGLFRTSISLGA